MDSPDIYTITAALPYANGPLHIGHIAGCYLPADIYARYLRSIGKDVLFVCGSDEHGVPITIKAKKEGISPQDVVNRYHTLMNEAFQEFGISFDIYGRTSSPSHHQFSADFFHELHKSNVFIEEETEQLYDPEAKQFLADRYILGACPNCQNSDAYGDQCEKCGRSLDPTDLINPRSALTGAKPILKATKNWSLPLDQIQAEFLNAYVQSHEKDWKSNVYGQCKSWLQEGLRPRAMTRDLDWGVKVPIEGQDGKVLYVWFDAPLGYISATKEYFENQENPYQWERYWKKDEGLKQHLLHFIGKDNIVFHCLIFPAMLHAYNSTHKDAAPWLIAEQIPANEFLNLEGQKISTSRQWAVWLHEYLEDFQNRQDELRYYLNSIAPDTKDSDFTWAGYQLAVNSELVAILGNFVNRVWVLIHKFNEGKVPLVDKSSSPLIVGSQKMEEYHQFMMTFRFRDAQSLMMDLFRAGNKYLADTEPWHLVKTNPEEANRVLGYCLNYIADLLPIMDSILPFTALKIKTLFGEANPEDIQTDSKLSAPKHLFTPIQDEEIAKAQSKLKQEKTQNLIKESIPALNTQPSEINFEDFTKLELKVVEIIEAEKVEGTDKLMKILIDTGNGKETVVSGIAHQMAASDIVGKQVLWLSNLQPRKIKGILSKGMLLMASGAEGKLRLMIPEAKVESGSKVS